MEIAAKPTFYNGVQFRSRLEARWAAFFDLCGWTWAYEPFELDGWLPDFSLGKNHQVLVEVKPLTPDELMADEVIVRPELAKAVRIAGSWSPEDERRVLVCGLGPFPVSDFVGGVSLGPFVWKDNADPSAFGFAYPDTPPFDISESWGSYAGRLYGGYDGNPHVCDSEIPQRLWRETGNLTQWKAPTP